MLLLLLVLETIISLLLVTHSMFIMNISIRNNN